MEAILGDLARYGIALVGFNVFLQQLGLPIPAVPTMLVAGALVAAGALPGAGVVAIAIVATVVADLIWFWAGRRFGYPVLRLLCRVSISPDSCVRQTEGIFERWGFYALVVSKFVPGFSTVAPPIAGALKMPVGPFLLATVASAALWVGAAVGTGFVFHSQIEAVLTWLAGHAGLAALLLLGLFALYLAWKAFRRWRVARFVEGAMIDNQALLQALVGERPPLVVDVGSRLAHQSRPHIPGARMLDLEAIDSHPFPEDRMIVFYCACPNEASAKRATQILMGRGFREVRPLLGGLDGWIAAGHPVEHGVPIAMAPHVRGDR